MTSIVRKMIDASASLTIPGVQQALQESDRGKRLVAYAFLYARPQAELLDDLVHSVIDLEDKPFGQYWGIQAIGRVVGILNRGAASPRAIQRLRAFLRELTPGTDRYYELNRILRGLQEDQLWQPNEGMYPPAQRPGGG